MSHFSPLRSCFGPYGVFNGAYHAQEGIGVKALGIKFDPFPAGLFESERFDLIERDQAHGFKFRESDGTEIFDFA